MAKHPLSKRTGQFPMHCLDKHSFKYSTQIEVNANMARYIINFKPYMFARFYNTSFFADISFDMHATTCR